MAAYRSSSENIGKMSLIHIFNKTSPWAHTESEVDMLGVHGKLVKYIVHFAQAAQTAINQFLFSRNFRG
jgi:hypothetical protein